MERGILSTIGHTPLICLNKLSKNQSSSLYAKLEMFNPGGSIKDRPAFRMLAEALESGAIKKNATIIESSSGNMAIGLAQVCRYLGLKLIVVVDPKINQHTLHILGTYGVGVEKVEQADTDGNYLLARLKRVQDLLDQVTDSYWPNQYTNKYNPAAHYHTMKEIIEALPEPPDYLLAATSTCGTIMGCANYVEQHGLHTKMVAVDAAGSVIFGAPPADRLVPGHGAGRPSDLLRKEAVDHVVHVSDKECITGCRRLLDREAILAGGSSGAVVIAAEKLQSTIPTGSTCALILPDSGERYLDTIYNDKWVWEHFGEDEAEDLRASATDTIERKLTVQSTCCEVDTRTQKPAIDKVNNTGASKIAIVGGGPKGMYGFERLAARFNEQSIYGNVEVHIYDRGTHFGAGDTYRPDQPGYLLTNNSISEINMWINDTLPPVAPDPLSLKEWLRSKNKNTTAGGYVSRGTVGGYLEEGFEQIASNLPSGMKGKYIIGEVIDICKEGKEHSLTLKTAAGSTENSMHKYDFILLATGHPRNHLPQEEQAFRQFACENKGVGFIPFIYPVQSMLMDITPRDKVGVKGVGLTFVDAVLALTEGKGGRFENDERTGKLNYQPSGREPEAIYPFSRSGMPMIPRKPAPADKMPLKFFTIETLRTLNRKKDKLDFKKEILPLLKQEMIYTFYRVSMEQRDFGVDLKMCDSFDNIQYHIDAFHQKNADATPFDPDMFLEPLRNQDFENGGDFNKYIQSTLEFFIREAQKGEQASPWAAVTAVWRKATPVFGEVYSFGGLTPASQRYFDEEFRRLLNRVAFGPPAESVQKLVALMKAGILNFKMAQNPSVELDREAGMFVLESNKYHCRQPINYIVDARISKISLTDDAAPLYRNLLDRGLISMYHNVSGRDSYKPGCLTISPEGFAIDKRGDTNFSIAVTGTPTEGITFDNDTLSRNRNNFVSDWARLICKSYIQPVVNSHA